LSLGAGALKQVWQWLEKSFDELGEALLRLKEPEFAAIRLVAQFKVLLQRAGHEL
jgi:hypothetical protein